MFVKERLFTFLLLGVFAPVVVIHLYAEDDDAAHCGDEVGPEDCEALAKDAKHNTLQHKGDAANANH